MKKQKKHISWNWAKIIWWFIFLTMVVSVVFSSIEMALAPSVPDPSQPYKRVKGDYVLMLPAVHCGRACHAHAKLPAQAAAGDHPFQDDGAVCPVPVLCHLSW